MTEWLTTGSLADILALNVVAGAAVRVVVMHVLPDAVPRVNDWHG